ncbi:MAG TPA: XkdX family protein [Candidatus Faecousia excrementigallinarum]|uniref:XkdX family protein n=1 Tax=Candidatus Faecousia excrementigallinarum TaxID=2840806 RepID=A0A9D0Z1U1_9FIRM|nr:XkdX family protein [Candidatus Faecousia excrementigallinarum]
MKEMIKRWYRMGLWDASMVENAVGRILTREEAEEIISSKEE